MSWAGISKRHLRAVESVDHRTFRRRKRRRRLKQGAVWLGLILVVTGIGFGGVVGAEAGWVWVRTHTDFTRVREINVRSTQWIPEWEVVELCGLVQGEDLFEIDLNHVRELLEAHPRVARAVVRRQYWDRSITIRVEEHRPLAVILDGETVEMGLGGLTLGAKPEDPLRSSSIRGSELPLLTGEHCSAAPSGTRLESRGIRRALAYLALLEEYNLPGHKWISEICVSDPESLVVYLLDKGTPVRIGKGRVSRTRMRAFFAVLDDLKGKGIEPLSIDLRFANQIVVQDS